MRNPIYTEAKLAGALREQLKKKQEAMIKKIKPKRDSYDRMATSPTLGIATQLLMAQIEGKPTKSKLWYLLVVLKKVGISLEEVGDEMGLRPF